LVRMLLRNLLQNALRHTLSRVEVHILLDGILIRDFGTGLPEDVAKNLMLPTAPQDGLAKTDQFTYTTFVLLIVRLGCERLGWKIRVVQSDGCGTEIQIGINVAI